MVISPHNHSEPIHPKVIDTTDDYEAALMRVEELFNSKPGTLHGNELELLLFMVEAYEKKAFPIDPPHSIEATRFRMEQGGTK